jgi:transcriptional regulator with XRE-family HTH domain
MQELRAIQPVPGPTLADERRRLGIRQRDLAARLGMHRVTLHGLERAAEVDPIRAARYARALRELVEEAAA